MFFGSSSIRTICAEEVAEQQVHRRGVAHLLGLDHLASLEEEILHHGGDVRLLAIETEDLWRDGPTSVGPADENLLGILRAHTVTEHLADECALAAEGHDGHTQFRELASDREKRSEHRPCVC
jgi:hypothetical protein